MLRKSQIPICYYNIVCIQVLHRTTSVVLLIPYTVVWCNIHVITVDKLLLYFAYSHSAEKESYFLPDIVKVKLIILYCVGTR